MGHLTNSIQSLCLYLCPRCNMAENSDFLTDHTETESAIDDLALRVTEQAELLMSPRRGNCSPKSHLGTPTRRKCFPTPTPRWPPMHHKMTPMCHNNRAECQGTLPTTSAQRSLRLPSSIHNRLLPSSDSDQSQNPPPTLVSPRTSMFFDNPSFNHSQLYSCQGSDGTSTVSSASQLHDDADNESSDKDDPLEAALKRKYKTQGPNLTMI